MANYSLTSQQPDRTDSSVIQIQVALHACNKLESAVAAQIEILHQRGIHIPSSVSGELKELDERLTKLKNMSMSRQIRLQHMRGIAETSALVNSSLRLDKVLNRVMDTVIQLTGAERGYIVLRNPDTNAFEFMVARGMDESQIDTGEFTISRTIVNEVSESGNAALTDNASSDERYLNVESIVSMSLRSILAVPMKVQNEIIGVIYCDNRMISGVFEQNDLGSLGGFAGQAAIAIENARLFESSQNQLDEVTSMREMLDNIFSSVVSGIITVNSENVITTCNRAAYEILAKEQPVGLLLQDVLDSGNQTFFDAIEEVREHHDPITLNLQLSGGVQEAKYWIVQVSYLDRGDDNSIVILIDDVTERQRGETRITELQRYLPSLSLLNLEAEALDLREQKRFATILLADIRGFTDLSEKLEPEDSLRIINYYLAIASEQIGYFGGMIVHYVGDAVLGLFNTQLNPLEDHVQRAVEAAQRIIENVAMFHRDATSVQALHFGIGIHTDWLIIGNTGSQTRKEFNAIGYGTSICKFLEGQAKGNEILLSPQSYQIVKNRFDFQERRLDSVELHDLGVSQAYSLSITKTSQTDVEP